MIDTDTDDDNDGLLDGGELAQPTHDADTDDDDVNDLKMPLDASETMDTDDGVGNNADTDDDADGMILMSRNGNRSLES